MAAASPMLCIIAIPLQPRPVGGCSADVVVRQLLFRTESCELGGQELKERQREVMQEVLMDMLRALVAPNMDIRKKVLDIALDLIDQRNIDEARSLVPQCCPAGMWCHSWDVACSEAFAIRCGQLQGFANSQVLLWV